MVAPKATGTSQRMLKTQCHAWRSRLTSKPVQYQASSRIRATLINCGSRLPARLRRALSSCSLLQRWFDQNAVAHFSDALLTDELPLSTNPRLRENRKLRSFHACITA